ncbi:MAG: ribonuclease E activity regulator RraA [Gemmatimonadota bacterium]|nr:ribonuclease E activity regulator RraA [Gemmatimonadota bacterium]MDE2954691.1 ribonuclease E activity regulator RraA [Gemmatimonadota bacterium]
MAFKTTDLCDEHETDPALQVAEPIFNDYGGVTAFCGPIATVKVHEDNVLVREILETPGEGRVLVVDGEGSMWCALLGDMVAEIASDNGWSGIVINGGVRDVSELAQIEIGVKARFAVPRRSRKEGQGRQDTPLAFAGVTFLPGDYLYADEDGILIATRDLLDAQA